MSLDNGDKAIVNQQAWNVCKEALVEHLENCPVKQSLRVKKAYLVGVIFGGCVVSGISGSGFALIILRAFNLIGS